MGEINFNFGWNCLSQCFNSSPCYYYTILQPSLCSVQPDLPNVMWRVVVLAEISVLIAYVNAIMPYPWHASCKIKWEIEESCEEFKTKIINQISEWEGESLCGTVSDSCPGLPCGQKCLYQFISTTPSSVVATHTTPLARYVDDVSFTMVQKGSGCSIDATSTSQTWYAVLDYGTNYCNLRNLVDGAGISGLRGFSEITEDSVCTQYSTRDCNRY